MMLPIPMVEHLAVPLWNSCNRLDEVPAGDTAECTMAVLLKYHEVCGKEGSTSVPSGIHPFCNIPATISWPWEKRSPTGCTEGEQNRTD